MGPGVSAAQPLRGGGLGLVSAPRGCGAPPLRRLAGGGGGSGIPGEFANYCMAMK